nr:alanine racemase [Treponema sp.]
IAVLPIGYADGLLRRFSPGLQVTINGKNYPVRGRICMDQCMVDIGKNNKDVKLFDTAMIFGPEESGALNTADDLAKIGNTISYEVLTSLSKRVERKIR